MDRDEFEKRIFLVLLGNNSIFNNIEDKNDPGKAMEAIGVSKALTEMFINYDQLVQDALSKETPTP